MTLCEVSDFDVASQTLRGFVKLIILRYTQAIPQGSLQPRLPLVLRFDNVENWARIFILDTLILLGWKHEREQERPETG